MVEANPKMFLVGKSVYEGPAHVGEVQSDEDELLDAGEVTEGPVETVEEISEEEPTLILVDANMDGYVNRGELMDALDKIAEAYPDVDASYQGDDLRAVLEETLVKAIEAVKDFDPDQSIIKV